MRSWRKYMFTGLETEVILVDIFIYHVWNIAYRINKLFGDVIENFSLVKNRCVMSKKKKSSQRLDAVGSASLKHNAVASVSHDRIRIQRVCLHLKPCIVSYSQEMSRICDWEHIWTSKSIISRLREKIILNLKLRRDTVCKLFDAIVYCMKYLYSLHERQWNVLKSHETIRNNIYMYVLM